MNHLMRIVLLATFCAVCVFPQGKGKGHGKGNQSAVSIGFSRNDVQLIQTHFGPGGVGLPPGLARKESLPPGLAKQLRRKGTLPPGLQKKVVGFPVDLDARLSPLPPGYRRVVVDRWAMIIATATNVIWDIIELGWRD